MKNDAKKDMIAVSGNIVSYAFVGANHSTVLGTTDGELLYMNNAFELRAMLDSNNLEGIEINCIHPLSDGKSLIAAEKAGKLFFCEKSDKDVKIPYTKSDRKVYNKVPSTFKIRRTTPVK